MTVALNQTGLDGVANSCCSLTATAANATILQSLTRASVRRTSGVWVKRLAGSGVVNMTQDGGTTWVSLGAIPASFGQFSQPLWTPTTAANPIVGFQIVTSGDAIAVDFVAHRETASSNPGLVGEPIGTTTASVAIAADRLTFPYNQTTLSCLANMQNVVFGGATGALFGGDVITTWAITTNAQNLWALYENGINLGQAGTANLQSAAKLMCSGNNTIRNIVYNAGVLATSATPLTGTGVYANGVIGNFGPSFASGLNGDISLLALWNNQIATTADMQALTT
jgi:hypothetical protein